MEARERMKDAMRHFPTLLRRWKGADARLLWVTLSHQTLKILLTVDGRDGNLVICAAPKRIEMPVKWSNADIQIELHPDEDEYRIIDEAAGVRIECEGSVRVAENEKEPWRLAGEPRSK